MTTEFYRYHKTVNGSLVYYVGIQREEIDSSQVFVELERILSAVQADGLVIKVYKDLDYKSVDAYHTLIIYDGKKVLVDRIDPDAIAERYTIGHISREIES